MRNINISVYKFNELSKDVQDKVIKRQIVARGMVFPLPAVLKVKKNCLRLHLQFMTILKEVQIRV